MYLGRVTRGDTEVITFAVTNPNGTARNISTDTIKFTIKRSQYDEVALVQKTVGSGIVKTNTTGGIIEVTLNPADLQTLGRDQTLRCDVEVTDSAGKVSTDLHTLDFVLDIST